MRQLVKFLPLSIVALSVCVMMSCKDKGPHLTPEVKFTATLSGANEIPTVSGSGAGKFEGVYNKDTKTLNYTITYSGLSGAVTGQHIHNAGIYENGPVMVTLAAATGSTISGSATLTQKQENELFVERTYINLHTAKSPSGEIRGQVLYADYTNR